MLKLLEHYLRKHRLARPGERLGVAVSGGADSVALLRALAELAPNLGVVLFVLHLNHNLRGLHSEADSRFVADLASQLSLDSAIESEDVSALASFLHLSLEAAGRRARYAFFQRAAAEHRLDCVATAHTRDDQAETVLLRLLRGTGTSGLAGIHRSFDLSQLSSPADDEPHPVQPPRLIRPLLCTTRQQVEKFLLSLGQPFCQDASNLSPKFLRNRVRMELLPALESSYNPRLRDALCETAEVAAAENDLIEDLVTSILGLSPNLEHGIELELFQVQPLALQRRILRRLCRPHALALDFAHIESLREFALAARTGRLELPRGFSAEISRKKHLSLLPPHSVQPDSAPFSMELAVPGHVCLTGKAGLPVMSIRATVLDEVAALPTYNHSDMLCAERVGTRLTVRNLLPGDRFQPLGSSGDTKISRLLQGLYVPAAFRRSWPVVLDAGNIVWVPGLSAARQVAWSPGDGKALILEVCSGEVSKLYGEAVPGHRL